MNSIPLKGIVSYPVTPFRESDGAVDVPALEALIDRLVAEGSHAIAPLGSTGESAYLDDDEWDAVADASVRRVARRLPVVVGISDLTTQGAMRRARFAESLGADAVMVLPVSYWKLTEQEVFGHFERISRAIGIPVMVYNNPATAGIDLSPELICRMVAQIDNVTMVKESSGDIQRMHRIAQLSDGRVPFFNGSNPLALEAFAAGAVGWCTAAPNLIPQWPMRLYEACVQGDMVAARELFYRQLPVLQFILKGGLPTTVKAGLRVKGFDAGLPRLPLQPLDLAGIEQLRALLQRLQG